MNERIKIGIVSSRFNNEIVEKISEACISKLQALGVSEKNILHLTVPGALEIPIALQQIKENEDLDNPYEVMIAIGAVIRGETYHFELTGILKFLCTHFKIIYPNF